MQESNYGYGTKFDTTPGFGPTSGLASNPELVLLGGQTLPLNQTRVLTANLLSDAVRPVDLDAFCSGYFHAG